MDKIFELKSILFKTRRFNIGCFLSKYLAGHILKPINHSTVQVNVFEIFNVDFENANDTTNLSTHPNSFFLCSCCCRLPLPFREWEHGERLWSPRSWATHHGMDQWSYIEKESPTSDTKTPSYTVQNEIRSALGRMTAALHKTFPMSFDSSEIKIY